MNVISLIARIPSIRWRVAFGLFVGISAFSQAQVNPTTGLNYIIEQTPRTTQTTVTLGSSSTDVTATVAYLDGLGRPLQTVQVRGAGNAANDIVVGAITYDPYGRPDKTFLPLPSGPTPGGGLLNTPQTSGQSFYGDTNPYAQTLYEATPQSRPLKQWGAGAVWRQNNRSQQIRYGVAAANTVIRFRVDETNNAIVGNNGTNWQYFGPNDIATRQLTDEQNNVVVEFSDLQGRMIRRDVQTANGTLTTFYVYDTYERLAAVIPPKLYNWFLIGGPTRTLPFYDNNGPNALFTESAFAYAYDARSRLIRQHTPGAGWKELVYDQQDRLVMSQDQQDKTEGNGASPQWRFTTYDSQNRPTQTGRLPLSRTPAQLRADFAATTGNAFPATVSPTTNDLLTQNYYDSNGQTSLAFSTTGAFGQLWATPTGALTGSRIRNLETGAWYETAQWYEPDAQPGQLRVIQQQSQNHLGGTDRMDMQYQFNGEVLQTVWRHQPGANAPIVVVNQQNTYDHWGRRTAMIHQVDGGTVARPGSYTYDAIGRLSDKRMGGGNTGPAQSGQTGPWTQANTWQGNAVPGLGASVSISTGQTVTIPTNATVGANRLWVAGKTTFATGSVLRLGSPGDAAPQRQTYHWHLRGMLRGINLNPSNNNLPDLSGGRVFGFRLNYEESNQYNGNIGSQTWLHSRDNLTRTYGYLYDEADRLTSALYFGGQAGEDFRTDQGYDPNGNILSLYRAGADQLSYAYSLTGLSNKLTTVTDATSNTLGFMDGNTAGDDYDYYPDGSLKKDLNRGITLIEYNLLKLPRRITRTNSTTITYQYDAGGQKLRMVLGGMISSTGITSGVGVVVTQRPGDLETRDYVGPFQYVNNTLFEIGHEEGRFTPTGGYEYFHKDHLGNVRAVVGPTGLTQYSDYDPWGLPLWGGLSGGNSTNRSRFLGKESLPEVGYTDLQARFYDQQIGRFITVDPLTDAQESFSPYHYSFNNPLRFSDPDGRMGDDCCGAVVNFLTGVGNALAQDLSNTTAPTNGLDRLASFRNGQAFGHGLSVMVGVGEVALGAAGAVVSGGVALASGGTLSVPAAAGLAVGAAVAGHGVSTIKNGVVNSVKDENGRVNASSSQESHQTYTKENPQTGEVYSGRTKGTGTPERNVAKRDQGHHMNDKGFGPAVLDKSSTNPSAIRGREQQLIERNGGAKSTGGTSGNAINGIGPNNKKGQEYRDAATKQFGPQ